MRGYQSAQEVEYDLDDAGIEVERRLLQWGGELCGVDVKKVKA